jgi:predicted permease
MSNYDSHDDSNAELPPEVFQPPVDQRVANELAFHIEMRTREMIAQGVAPDVARRMATERFGDIDSVAAELNRLERGTDRTVRRARYVAELAHDARFAFRMMGRRRTFAALAIATLALGIGAATAIYSVVDTVMLRPLPFDEPDGIAAVWLAQPSVAKDPVISWLADATPMGPVEYNALRQQSRTLRDLAMWAPRPVTLTTENGPERLPGIRVTSTLLPALRVRPALGRVFAPGEDALGGPLVTMLSYETWSTRFGADSSLIGRSLTLNGKPHTVIGVLPMGVRVDRTTEMPAFWIPALQDSADLPAMRNRSYSAVARLAPGATFASATQETAALLRAINGDTSMSARVEAWQRDQSRDARGPLLVLLAAVGLLLLIACVNVAILQLGEGSARGLEMTTRAALGAGSGRLARQLLVESVAIALVSAVLGAALAGMMMRGLIAAAPAKLPGIDQVALNGRVLVFAVTCATFTGLLFGVVPAFVVARTGTGSLVRIGVGHSGRGTRQLQRLLIASQLALSLILLVGAALLSRSLRALANVSPGFTASRLTSVSIAVPRSYYRDDDRVRSFSTDLVARVGQIPGVERASVSSSVPFVSGGGSSSPLTVETPPGAPEIRPRHTQQRYVQPGFFETMGMQLKAGRFFTAEDRNGSEPVAIVSEEEVKRDFGGRQPLGMRVQHQRVWRRVVGVVADVKYRGLGEVNEATVYIPLYQYVGGLPTLVIRGSVGPAFAQAVKATLREVEPDASVLKIEAIPQLIEKSYAAERYRTLIVTLFGIMASVLAAVGLYGVGVRAAARRNREIGVRIALGSSASGITRLLVGDAMAGVALGLAVGFPGALVAARLVRPYLFNVGPRDPVSFGASALLLVAVTALASFLPARVAGRENPAKVLRGD